MPFLSAAIVREARGPVGVIAFFGLIGSVAAIIAGGYMVYLGNAANSEIKLFGQAITTGSSGVACVFLGIVCLILVVRRAFSTLEKAIAAP